MTNKEVIHRLQKEAKDNPASNAAFHWFCIRKRTRGSITLTNLQRKLVIEGHKYDKLDYIPLLRCLAELKLGTLRLSPRGGVRGLDSITTTLKSIGEAALGAAGELQTFKQRTKYESLPTLKPKPEVIKQIEVNNIDLDITVNNTLVHLSFPRGVEPAQIGNIITKLVS